MNLGIIAASIATLRPLFVNLGPMVQIGSDTTRGPYASDRLFAKKSKSSSAGTRLRGILLSPMGSTKTNEAEFSKDSLEALEERG